MNPLTQVKNTQKIIARELAIGISEGGSWHAKYKDSAYVYVGGLPYTLTEGDVLAVFAQYGEIVDVNLVRDKATGKSKGFAFLAYEDQRSTVLAVDNLNGARVVDRIIKVDHVGDYKRKLEEDEEEKQKKREERGVCYAFQRGECNRGDDCKFSHDEQRNANTGWGDGGAGRGNGGASWKHDQFDGSMKEASRRMNMDSSTNRNDVSIDEKPRGVCYAFQRGDCNRGDSCKFAHDEQKSMNSGRGGGGAGWKPDQFSKSMKDTGRRMNMENYSPERNRTGNDKSMKPPDDIRRKDDGQRRRDADRGRADEENRDAYLEDRRRDDGQRRRDGDRDDRRRTRDGDDRDEERRVSRGDNREGSYERRDPETSSFKDEEGGRRDERWVDRKSDRRGRSDEKEDVRKEMERSNLRDGHRDYERSGRSRR